MIGLETSRGGKTNLHVSLQDAMSYGHVSRQIALRRITSCFSFRYKKKQVIALLVGKHEDLFNPGNSCLSSPHHRD